jgi:hypothetical protein
MSTSCVGRGFSMGGAYFEAHEAWEDRWRLETDETWRR